MTKKQFERLPKWAQHLIQKQKADLDSMSKRLVEALGDSPTSVIVSPYSDTPCYLRERDIVRYMVGKDWDNYIDVQLVQYNKETRLQLRCGALEMAVIPSAGNTVTVATRGR
jgi:hypothetical protein